ncbi:MAG: SMC-Scp complex subunit ScpB [Nanoarchaeota archaeon]
MQDIKNKVEAVLFTTGKYLSVEDISNLIGITSHDEIKTALDTLIQEYNSRNSSLEIIQQGNQYKFTIRKEHMHLTTQLLRDTELDKPTQETLALIAYKQPVLQSLIVKMRGNTAYEHVAKLSELQFIESEKSGRTRLIKTTSKFYEYFDVVDKELKEKFSQVNKENETQE